MTMLTRRTLLKTAAVAGLAGTGAAAFGRLTGLAAPKPEPLVLKTACIEARLQSPAKMIEIQVTAAR